MHTIYGNHCAFTGWSDFGLPYRVLQVGDELIYERQGEALLVPSYIFAFAYQSPKSKVGVIQSVKKGKEKKSRNELH